MMDDNRYFELCAQEGAIQMERSVWEGEQFHIDKWKEANITVLICQRKTPDLIRLCLESLFRYYPTIPVLVMEGNSQDDSTLYLRYKECVTPNLTVVNYDGVNAHGDIMDLAIQEHIKTDYVLLMDSDIITERGGYIEDMLRQMQENPNIYAIGAMMLVTRNNDGCGAPESEEDVLRYAHPSTSIYHVPRYKTLRPFWNHGAPNIYNTKDAIDKGYEIAAYPVDKYTCHLSGASWQEINAVWDTDHGIKIRPFITFIVDSIREVTDLGDQVDHDFDIMLYGNQVQKEFVIHRAPSFKVNNFLYDIRFKIGGEYVCELPVDGTLPSDFVLKAKFAIIAAGAPEEIEVNGFKLVRRQLFQKRECIS